MGLASRPSWNQIELFPILKSVFALLDASSIASHPTGVWFHQGTRCARVWRQECPESQPLVGSHSMAEAKGQVLQWHFSSFSGLLEGKTWENYHVKCVFI